MPIHKWRTGTLFGRLMISHLVVILLTLLILGFLFLYLVEKYFFSAREWELASQAERVADILGAKLQEEDYGEVEKVARTLAASMEVKIRVIEPSEKREIIVTAPRGDLSFTEVNMEKSEIDQVLQGNVLTKKVYGPGVQQLLVAIPIYREQEDEDAEPEIIGAITVSAPLSEVKATIAQISRLALYSGILAVLIAGTMAFSLAKTISRPLRAITRAAQSLVNGNFRSRIDINAKGEVGELAATFNQAVYRIEETVAEEKRLQALQKNFVTNVSHEFRAPLTSIQGFVEAILDGYVKEEEREKYLRVILDNTLHLNRLVNDLLDLSSIENNQLQLRWEPVSPHRIAERAWHSLLPRAREKDIDLRYEPGEGPSTLWGDEDRLFQVLINLLENAITYTQNDGRVILGLSGDEKGVLFSVSDNGQGIPPEDLPYIWNRFYKVDKARDRANRGKGLGLALVKELVHLHHGEISAESEVGKGSVFHVYLPVIAGEEPREDSGEEDDISRGEDPNAL